MRTFLSGLLVVAVMSVGTVALACGGDDAGGAEDGGGGLYDDAGGAEDGGGGYYTVSPSRSALACSGLATGAACTVEGEGESGYTGTCSAPAAQYECGGYGRGGSADCGGGWLDEDTCRVCVASDPGSGGASDAAVGASDAAVDASDATVDASSPTSRTDDSSCSVTSSPSSMLSVLAVLGALLLRRRR